MTAASDISGHYTSGNLLARLEARLREDGIDPARCLARRFGCRVSGIDLTAEFCDAAPHLTSLLGLEDRVSIEQCDALAMPFDDAAFDGAGSMNVSIA